MSRYSTVHRKVWTDAKFMRLSAAPPNAQTLFLRLLTGPERGPLPGLIPVGAAGLAEALGWEPEPLRERFGELFREGLAKADWKARLIWLPNAIKHDPPANPNVVRGWRDFWKELPECKLKDEALNALRTFFEPLPEGFRKAFQEVFGNGLANQEQEQEQEQEKEREGASPPANPPPPVLFPVCVGNAKNDDGVAKPAKRESRKKPQTPCPPSEASGPEVEAWCQRWKLPSPTADPKLHRFLDWHRAEGRQRQDWLAAWRNWDSRPEWNNKPGRIVQGYDPDAPWLKTARDA